MWKQWKQWQTIFLCSKVTADGDCSHEIKRCLLLGSKAMTNWDSILKSRHIPLPTNVRLVKAIVFPVVMYGCESWTIKKSECWRIDDFELWCWRRLLRVSWAARRSNQPILKEISPDYSLEGLMLKLKLQSFGHLMGRTDSFEKILMLGKWKLEEKGTTEDEMFVWHHWLDGRDFEQDPGVGDGQGGLAYCSAWCCKVRHDWVTELNWTEWVYRASQVELMVKNPPVIAGRRHKRHRFNPWVGKIPWRREWQPTPVFLSGGSHGERSLVGCIP